jgi:hypothetical protein
VKTLLRWLDTGEQNEEESLIQSDRIRRLITEILRSHRNLEKIKTIAVSRTAGIWRIKRAKILLLTMEGTSIERIVLEVRVPPDSILKCQSSFSEQGLKYFDNPGRQPTSREARVERLLAFLENPLSEQSAPWREIRVQYIGHEFSAERIWKIKNTIGAHPHWTRNQITHEVCRLFDLRQSNGKSKHAQIGQALVRMAMDNLITLPAKLASGRTFANSPNINPRKRIVDKIDEKVVVDPSEIDTLQLIPALNSKDLSLWRALIEKYHYLSTSKLFGAQMRYLVYGGKNIEPTVSLLKTHPPSLSTNNNWQNIYRGIDRGDHLLAVIGFASSAWKLSSRDRFIGWNDEQRVANLKFVINNARFLILPWLRIPNLASRILSGIAKQLPFDWEARYLYRPVLLETFVQTDRFKGTCYRAANWIQIGKTAGYSLYSKCKKKSPPKAVFVYPLFKDFQKRLLK